MTKKRTTIPTANLAELHRIWFNYQSAPSTWFDPNPNRRIRRNRYRAIIKSSRSSLLKNR
jgi:hypothetical protein